LLNGDGDEKILPGGEQTHCHPSLGKDACVIAKRREVWVSEIMKVLTSLS
jgi:hypothetical protein